MPETSADKGVLTTSKTDSGSLNSFGPLLLAESTRGNWHRTRKRGG
jgi:hypothetical protein